METTQAGGFLAQNPGEKWLTELGAAVRLQRRRLGLTQLEVAALAGCGPVFLYDLESGRKRTLQVGKLLDVLRVLGLQLALEPGQAGLRVSGKLA